MATCSSCTWRIEERAASSEYAQRRRGGSQACLCQKEKRYAYQRRRFETNHLSFG